MNTSDTDVEFLDSVEGPIGLLYLCRYRRGEEWVYDVNVDGALLMSSVSPLSERELATQAIAAHPGTGLRVLVAGLGLGYTALAALEDPRVTKVRVVERMDFVISWMTRGLLPLSETLLGDPRLELVEGDAYADLLGDPDEAWDLILVDVDHSPRMVLDPASRPFYTVAGQRTVARHLTPSGLLAVWSAFDDDEFAAVLDEAYDEAWRSPVAWVVEHADDPDQHLHNTLFFGRL